MDKEEESIVDKEPNTGLLLSLRIDVLNPEIGDTQKKGDLQKTEVMEEVTIPNTTASLVEIIETATDIEMRMITVNMMKTSKWCTTMMPMKWRKYFSILMKTPIKWS